MIRIRNLVLSLAVVACTPLGAFAQGAAGSWELTIQTPQGATAMNVTLTQTGDAIAGTLSSPLGSVPLKGTATGANLTVAGNLDVQGTSLTLTFKGKVDGDTFNGNVQFGEMGEGPFTGTRAGQKAAASATSATGARPTSPVATDSGASGKWDMVMTLPSGDLPIVATMSQAGDKITGTLSSQLGESPVSGMLTGNSITLTFTATTPNGAFPVSMTGTLAAGTFTGKADIQGVGEANWTAKRAQ